MADAIDDRELALAREHPRGTEMRRLAPYREALRDPAAYAALPERDRDVIVHWAEVRWRIRGEIDADATNIMERLVPAPHLRALIVAGERLAAGGALTEDGGGDLRDLVGRIRGA